MQQFFEFEKNEVKRDGWAGDVNWGGWAGR